VIRHATNLSMVVAVHFFVGSDRHESTLAQVQVYSASSRGARHEYMRPGGIAAAEDRPRSFPR
jgi:hypothetical protein